MTCEQTLEKVSIITITFGAIILIFLWYLGRKIYEEKKEKK